MLKKFSYKKKFAINHKAWQHEYNDKSKFQLFLKNVKKNIEIEKMEFPKALSKAPKVPRAE